MLILFGKPLPTGTAAEHTDRLSEPGDFFDWNLARGRRPVLLLHVLRRRFFDFSQIRSNRGPMLGKLLGFPLP